MSGTKRRGTSKTSSVSSTNVKGLHGPMKYVDTRSSGKGEHRDWDGEKS